MFYGQYPYMNRTEVVKVNGENGARAFNMAPNSSVLLLDEQQPIVWLKTTDGAGYPSITAYEIKPYEQKPQPDLMSFEKRLERLEEIYESNTKPNKRKQDGASDGV